MANLETLELTINANAESASKGLSKLISSLSALSLKVQKTTTSLALLNKELATLKSNSNIKFSGIDKVATSAATRSIKTNTKALTDNAKATQTWAEAQVSANPEKFTNYRTNQNQTYKYKQADVGLKPAKEYTPVLQNTKNGVPINWNAKVEEVKDQMDVTSVSAEKVKTAFSKFSSGLKKAKETIGQMIPKFHLLNRVMRIASTMLIRMGLKALFKGAKEGLENYYQYAKATNNEVAQSMDTMYSSWTQLKNQMGAAIAPAISAAIPVINALASAAITAFNALSQLFALLTGRGSWSKATNGANQFGESIKQATGGGGGGGIKEMLAQFDELNVIASESGGGGGAGAAAQAYEDMFEEMTQFDKEIERVANMIKDVVGWIKDNIEVILESVGLIGIAILGWKLSKAFEGFMSTLGKWIAGGALIAVGIVLEFDFGKKLGAYLAGGKGLAAADVFEGIVGLVAAAIGGYIIGGGLGAAVAVGIAVTALIGGIIVGWKNEKDKQKWGNRSLTPEDIERLVISQFKFEVDVEIDLMNTVVNNSRVAKAHLDREIWEFSQSLSKIKVGVDTSDTAIDNAIAKYNEVKTKLQESISADQEMLTAYFKIMPYNEKDETGMIENVFSADEELMAYFTNAGTQLANLFDQGMRTGWKNNEKEDILALMEHIDNVLNNADELYEKYKLEGILSGTFKDIDYSTFDRDTAMGILQKQKEALEEYRKAAEEINQELYDSLLKRAAYAESAGLDEEAKVYREAADKLLDEFETAYNEKLSGTMEDMRKSWITTLQKVYNEDYGKDIKTNKNTFINYLSNTFIGEGKEAAENAIKEFIDEIVQTNEATIEVSDVFDLTGWDLLSNELRRQFVSNVYQAVGVQGVSMLKNSLNLSANEIIKFSGWHTFSQKQKLEFLSALTDAFGSVEALNAAKQAGINVSRMIEVGMESKDADVVKVAENLREKIKGALNTENVGKSVADGIKNGIESINPQINIKTKIDAEISAKVVVESESGASNVKVHSVIAKPAQTTALVGKYDLLNANGAYGIPKGDVFIANEAGAELVGSINGKTSVANQGQIIEGIRQGVESANSQQNALLMQQNELLRRILEKDNAVRIAASSALGRTVRQSLDMYSMATGV